MDLANQLFSVTLGVEPNKTTLQKVAGALNAAVLSLSDQSKALENFADTVQPSKFSSEIPPLTRKEIQNIQAAPTPQAAQARKAKVLRAPVKWQITEQQMKELIWKRKQLLQAQKAELERRKRERAQRAPPPKLGKSKAALAKDEKARQEQERRRAQQKSQGSRANLPPPRTKPRINQTPSHGASNTAQRGRQQNARSQPKPAKLAPKQPTQGNGRLPKK